MNTQKLTSQWYRLVAGVVLAFAMIGNNVYAANKYWDGSTAANLQAGNGDWDTASTAMWSTGTAGSSPLVTWADFDDAFFQFAAGTSLVTNNGVRVGNISFDNGGAITRIVPGTGPLTLKGNITLNWNNGGSGTTNWINSDIILTNNTTITLARNYGDGANGNFLQIGGAISEINGSRKVTIAPTSSTGGGGNGAVWLDNGNNSFSGGFDAGGRYVYTRATSGTPFGTGTIDTRVGYTPTPVVPIYLLPSGSGSDVSLSGANAVAGTRININGGGLFVLNKGSQNSLTFTAGHVGAAADSVLNRVGPYAAFVLQYSNTLGNDEKFIVNGGMTVVNGMTPPYYTGLKGSTADFLTYDAVKGLIAAPYDLTNTFTSSLSTSKVLLTAGLTLSGTAAAHSVNLRTGNLDLGTQTLTLGDGVNAAGLLMNGNVNNGTLSVPVVLAVTPVSGTINASVTGSGTLANAGGGTLNLSGNMSVANIAGSGGTITLNVNAPSTQTISSVVSIVSPGVLSKAGTGTAVLSSAGNSVASLTFSGGQLTLDNSLAASPSMTLLAAPKVNSGTVLDINNATLTAPGISVLGKFVVGGNSTFNTTGGNVTGDGDGVKRSFYFKGSSVINAVGRNFDLMYTQAAQANYAILQDNAQATFAVVSLLGNASYNDGPNSALLEIKDSAQLSTSGDLYVVNSANDANRTGIHYAFAEVCQRGGTVTVGGNLRFVENDQAISASCTRHEVAGSYNLYSGSTLAVSGRILGSATRANTNTMAFFNFHGGTLKYGGSSGQANWINLSGIYTNSIANCRVWEGATIDTGSQNLTNRQALLAPTGMGISAISTNGLTGTAYNNGCPPWIYISGSGTGADGGGLGATAIAQINSGGYITNIVVTNPGWNYTSKPTTRVVRSNDGTVTVPAANITLTANNYSGGLTKLGSGTLTLTATNTYTGPTIISNGTLRLTHAQCLPNNTDVYLYTGTYNSLDFNGIQTIRALYINGVMQTSGDYGRDGLQPSYFSGSGYLSPTLFPSAPTLSTVPTVNQIDTNQAALGITVNSDGFNPLTSWGTVWGTSASPTANSVAIIGSTNAPFSFSQGQSGMSAGQHTYARGWASNAVGIAYSPDVDFYNEPEAPTGLTVSEKTGTGFKVDWTPGNGCTGTLVVVALASNPTSAPTDGSNYVQNASFASGSNLGNGNYVVYAGAVNSVTVSNLAGYTQYRVMVYAFAGTGTQVNYQQDDAATTTAQTLAGPPLLTGYTVSNIDSTFATLGATVSSDGGATLLDRGTVWDTVTPPVAHSQSEGGTAVGAFTHVVTGMSPGQQYYFRGWSSNESAVGYSTDIGRFYTEPDAATSLGFPSVGPATLVVSWTPGTGSAGAVVVVRQGATPAAPTDGVDYSSLANSRFGFGTDLGGGSYVVYAGSGTGATVTRLVPSTTYQVAVYTYSGSGALLNYQTDTPATGSQATTILAAGPYTYTGDFDGNWDFVTANFIGEGGVGTPYTNDAPVTFNDTAIGPASVVLTSTLLPTQVAVSNNTLNYAFGGTGKLSGPMSLSKSGSGMLAVTNSTANDFTGGTYLNGGTLKLGSATILPLTLTNSLLFGGGTLDINGFAPALACLNGPAGGVTNSGAAVTLTLNSSGGKYTFGGAIMGSTLTLTKSGSYTQVLSSVGNSFNTLQPGNSTPGGSFIIDDSVVPHPTLTLSGGITSFRNDGGTTPTRFTMTAGTLTLGGDFRLSNDGNFSISTITGGTVNHIGGGGVQVGFNSGMAVFNVGSNAVYNASGRNLVLGVAYSCNSFANFYGSANANFGGIYLADGNGVGGTSQYGTLNVSENATLTGSSLSIGGTCNNATAAVYGMYNQFGGTVTINGTIILANNQSSGILVGSLNLAGGMLKTQKISVGTGTARLNFHGGTLAYTNTVGQADFIALGATGAAYIYEGVTIDTANHSVTNKQPLLSPTGSGVVNIAITAGGSSQFVPPSVKIVRNVADTTGVGATAIAQVNPITGVMTNILITNPGTDYTMAPTVTLDRGQGTLATLGAVSMGANSYTGGLTKIGSGTLTLTATSTYVGATVVSNGTLRLTHAQCLSASTAVSIVASAPNNAKVELDFTGTNTVQSLTIDGKLQLKNKAYNISNLPEALTGNVNGFLYTTGGASPPGTMIQFK
jgi:fibronectin-binding autotransporter adhesin